MTIGVYQILNKVNDKRYIGSSINIYNRTWQHFKNLSTGVHCNKYLQASWNKYGKDSFEFKTLIECSENDLLFYEDLIIKGYQSNNNKFGYNLREVTSSNKGMSLKFKTGDIYNRLTLLSKVSRNKWLCSCICGKEKVVDVFSVRANRVKSCGCLNNEVRSASMLAKHANPEWKEKHRELSRVTMTKTMSLEKNKRYSKLKESYKYA